MIARRGVEAVASLLDSENYRLADIVSDRLRDMTTIERSQYLRDTVSQVLTEERYRDGEERQERFRAVCAILGRRGGLKRNKEPRKARLVAKAGELFTDRELAARRSGESTVMSSRPYRSLWPELRDDMTPERRELTRYRQRQILGEMLYLSNLRRDDLLAEADGD